MSHTFDSKPNLYRKCHQYWSKLKYSPLILTILFFIWFCLRVIPKPSRAYYPCQRTGLSYLTLYLSIFFGGGITSVLVKFWRKFVLFLKSNYIKISALCLVVILSVVTYQFYTIHQENQLKLLGSRTITASLLSSQVKGISTSASLVSFNHDPLVNYGTVVPYDHVNNPAYDFVWQTVERLNLGSADNPLDDLINANQTVLIELNLVSDDYGALYTHPAVARPIIDMAIRAGANKVYVGDGGPGYAATEDIIDNTYYQQMINLLQAKYPAVDIQIVNLNDRAKWHWIYLGNASSFAGSGYSDYDMGASFGETLYGHEYYSTSDPQGINPNGQVVGWYAMSDYVLESDVVINVPKMKNHGLGIVTLALKNLVGTTLCSTYDDGDAGWSRIPHCKSGAVWQDYESSFGNDILWRSLLDLTKILLYVNQYGVLQPTNQRKYLNILDGIVANEQEAWGDYPYHTQVVIASTDPVAFDAVAARIMGYDFRAIPTIASVGSESNYQVGINDPTNIVIIGDEINSAFDYIFAYSSNWAEYADATDLAITDFNPPQIIAAQAQSLASALKITAEISDGLAVFVNYQSAGQDYVQAMSRSGNQYTLNIPLNSSAVTIIAQDGYFNSSSYQLPTSQPSITLTKSSNLSSASPNQEITYTIHYHNSSQFLAQNVTITDLIPSGTTYVQGSADATGGQYLTNPAQVEWQFNSLTAGEQGDVGFRVRVD